MRNLVRIIASLMVCAAADLPASARPTVTGVVHGVSQQRYTDLLAPAEGTVLYTRPGDNRDCGRSDTGYTPYPDHDAARDNIAAYFQALPGSDWNVSLDPFVFIVGGHDYTGLNNVVAVKEGVDPGAGMYVLGAHYDSVNNAGADDNASGVAGVMEAARATAGYHFRSTIVFIAFDAEEKGLFGSRQYASQHADDDIRGMISLDMIACDANGSDIAELCTKNSLSAGLQADLAQAFATHTPLGTSLRDGISASDHGPFSDEGIPSVLLIEPLNASGWPINPYYHQSGDHIDNTIEGEPYLDYAYATEMVRGTVGWLATAAGLAVEGDVDFDGLVDADDLATLGLHWAPNGAAGTWAEGDFTGDGDIDAEDLAFVGLHWQVSETVPEPALGCVLGLAGWWLTRRRRPYRRNTKL